MTIKAFYPEEGRISVGVFCDHCGKRIEDYREGNMYWNPDTEDGIILHGHKKCNGSFPYLYAWADLGEMVGMLAVKLKQVVSADDSGTDNRLTIRVPRSFEQLLGLR